ncbi:hypothetical protein VP496E541_P0048 [Vibrio phage 496E54-1]|nr:hypothetical protein VP495E541_P0048 [Vibrio phage 495E54-1]CAH9012655.1 hypothetical protein VP496E541_P0048 [Vibrio phage 496E54-1]
MDKTTLDYIKTQRLTDQITMLTQLSFVFLFSSLFTSAVFLNILSNVQMHTISGVMIIIGLLAVGNAKSLQTTTIIV